MDVSSSSISNYLKIMTDSLNNVTDTGIKNTDSSFENVLTDALKSVKEYETDTNNKTTELVNGETDELHSLMISAEKSELALSMALQVRNKVLSAYNEMMNMQI